MTYTETVDWLFSQLPVFKRDGAQAYKANLDNTHALDSAFGHPHQKYKTIHVAGTNGKGSTSHMLTSILMEAGLKVGLYTSPHLKDFAERIRINGETIRQDYVVDFVAENKTLISDIRPSFFEITVAMAFKYFADEQVDIAVIETGMGGRLDSTNIISPELSVITNISLDHTDFLGSTLEAIAGEKAGIIKWKTPVVIGRADNAIRPVFSAKALEQNAEIIFAENQLSFASVAPHSGMQKVVYADAGGTPVRVECPLLGIYQHENIRTVLVAAEVLKQQGLVSDVAVFDGIANVQENCTLFGRWQILGHTPLVVCDTGHNYDGVQMIAQQLATQNFAQLHIVWGMAGDKKADEIIPLLPSNAQFYICAPAINRAMPVDKLVGYFEKLGLSFTVHQSCAEALEAAKLASATDDFIFAGGSTFVVAEII